MSSGTHLPQVALPAHIANAVERICRIAPATAPVIIRTKQKWIHTGNGLQQLREFPDVTDSKVSVIDELTKAFENLQIWKEALAAIGNDAVFARLPLSVFFYNPLTVLRQALVAAMHDVDGKWAFFAGKAVAHLKFIYAILVSDDVTFSVTAPFLGVNLEIAEIKVSEDVRIVRLSLDQLNERATFCDPVDRFMGDGLFSSSPFRAQTTEIQLTLRTRRSQNIDQPNASMWMQEEANRIIARIELATQMTVSGGPVVGSISFANELARLGTLGSLFKLSPVGPDTTIGEEQSRLIPEWYRLLEANESRDRILLRAVQRFSLGKQRRHISDRIVDFVIAWESLLLTVNGTGLSQELSYRFAMNGAALLSSCGLSLDRNEMFDLMKTSYICRSTIVHGDDDASLNKKLKKAGYENLAGLCDDLEDKFRLAAFWIASLPCDARPYISDGGWERLVWSDTGVHAEQTPANEHI